MERSNYFGDQFVLANDLNNTESTKAHAIRRRVLAVLGNPPSFPGGTPRGLSNERGVIGFLGVGRLLPTAYGPSAIEITSGEAIGDSGELISYPGTSPYILLGDDTPNWAWPTGSAGPRYIKIRYMETGSILKSDDLGNPYYTRYSDSYFVQIDSVLPTVEEICLGTFTALSGGSISGSIVDTRWFIRANSYAENTFLRTPPVGGWTSVEDHILAKGVGVQTQNNPHGLTLDDLGWSDETTTHRKEAHVAGMVDMSGLYPDSIATSYSASVVSPSSNAYLSFAPPVNSNVGIVIGGTLFTGSIPNLTGATLYTISGNAVYNVYLASNGAVTGTTSTIENDNTKFWICTVEVADNGDDLINLVDYRRWFMIEPRIIRAEANAEGYDFVSIDRGVPSKGNLEATLARIRNRLGTAIGGAGVNWTDTPTMNLAQAAVHGHTGTSDQGLKLNADGSQWWSGSSGSVTSTNVNTLTAGSNSDASALHRHAGFQMTTRIDQSGRSLNTVYWNSGSLPTLQVVLVVAPATTLSVVADVAPHGSADWLILTSELCMYSGNHVRTLYFVVFPNEDFKVATGDPATYAGSWWEYY